MTASPIFAKLAPMLFAQALPQTLAPLDTPGPGNMRVAGLAKPLHRGHVPPTPHVFLALASDDAVAQLRPGRATGALRSAHPLRQPVSRAAKIARG